MKFSIKRSLCLAIALVIMSTLCISASATNIQFNRGYGYSSNLYKYSVSLVNGCGSEKITVVNTSGSPIDVYVGGIYRGRLNYKNAELTVAYYLGGTKTVIIDPVHNGTHTFRIKTTGYSDTIKKVR